MNHIRLAILAYFAVVAQTVLGGAIEIGGYAPDFLLLVLVTAIVTLDGWQTILWAAILGLLGDCLTPERLGLGMITVTLTATLVQRVCRREEGWSLASIVVVSFITVFIAVLTVSSLRILLAGRVVDVSWLLGDILGRAGYSTAVALGIAALWRAIRRLLPKMEGKAGVRGTRRWPMLTE